VKTDAMGLPAALSAIAILGVRWTNPDAGGRFE
jgi:hypothetical protein